MPFIKIYKNSYFDASSFDIFNDTDPNAQFVNGYNPINIDYKKLSTYFTIRTLQYNWQNIDIWNNTMTDFRKCTFDDFYGRGLQQNVKYLDLGLCADTTVLGN